MASPAYMWLQDSTGKAIPGSVAKAPKGPDRAGSVAVLEFEHQVRIPTDSDTGKLTAVRKHESVRLIKEFDRSSAALYKAVTQGETLKQVKISWYQVDKAGNEIEYFTHIFDDVKVCAVRPIMYNVKDPTKEKFVHMEEIELRYRAITWTHVNGNLTHSDAWEDAC